ncbi:MAG: response regulator [Drouetiella hepatica Uher 2000/2452]|jgi:chemosensory pili system protein ChpA (sensor histidine kinase/response regulator)|uniref:histidine kinase n=1 Tax=Drouetiella hepatica Uher 2000/2452 TaxID=904376 RepID=A0A951ULQ3_9CYAN|nr:response regulator [Drouetiella hepatica Uher 2000/2452]
MKDEREREIQHQFLDEAQEYLETLETTFLGIADCRVDIESINVALRAAHSIKGGAGMMGFQLLNQLAHRLEDGLKVLKIQREVEIDAELEGLLLNAVGNLGHVLTSDRLELSDESVDWQVIAAQVTPVFDQLHDRLGDPDDEDARSILGMEEGQDVVPLLFETEVESCLQQLETLLDGQNGQLTEPLHSALGTLAEELAALGEMLQLQRFTALCESILQHLEASPPERLEVLAEAALQAWRRSQALVFSGHLDLLPTELEGFTDASSVSSLSTEPVPIAVEEFLAAELSQPSIVEFSIPEILLEASADELSESASSPATPSVLDQLIFSPSPSSSNPSSSNPSSSSPSSSNPSRQPPAESEQDADFQRFEIGITSSFPKESAKEPAKETQENSVRVPVKHLDHLNDLLGELLIARSGLNLNLSRSRSLLRALGDRIEFLERSNTQLRDAYDQMVRSSGGEFRVDPTQKQPALLPAGDTDFAPSQPVKLIESNGFDLLEMDQYDETHLLSQEVMETIVQIQEANNDLDLTLEDTDMAARELNKTAQQLQRKLSQIRMRPLSDVIDRFPRSVREMSLQYGKLVELQTYGENTLVDRNILESLSEPLMHLIRNAFDHGIEMPEIRKKRNKPDKGTIEIRAVRQKNRMVITVRDDGEGIAVDKIRSRAGQMGLDQSLLATATDEELVSLIFEPGFSTSSQVTALSGRGVGMDVVRDRLKQIQGSITVSTHPGVGTTFTLSVPFALSVTRVLLAECKQMPLAFPIDVIEETLVLQPEAILHTPSGEAFSKNGVIVQLVHLAQWLKFHRPRQFDEMELPTTISVPTVLVVQQGDRKIGLQVDRCWGEQEVAIRKVEGGLPLPPGFANCTILGDGRVVPLVSTSELLHWISSYQRHLIPESSAQAEASNLLQPASERRPTVLIIDDSINVRRFLALTLQKAGYQVAQAKDGQDAIDKLTAGLKIQAVFCDIEMPRLDGYGFLARFKSDPAFSQIPVAMLTSRSSRKHRQIAENLGADAYFSKPYNEQMLLQTLEKMVDLALA